MMDGVQGLIAFNPADCGDCAQSDSLLEMLEINLNLKLLGQQLVALMVP